MRRRTWVALGVGLGVALARLRPFRVLVAGESMAPALLPGDQLLVVRARRVRRGHVVVVRPPGSGVEMIKRVAGVPGERVELGPSGAWTLGPDEYLVLGDNRSRSTDARSFGPVPASAIAGRAVLRLWPGAGLVH